MRLLICAGGTGGGVYPALAVLQAVKTLESGDARRVGKDMDTQQINQDASTDTFLWVGSDEGMDSELLKRARVPFEGISAAGVHGVGLGSLPGNVGKLAKGYFQSRKILKSFKPDVLFFTGGYVAVPMAAAGIRYPALLYVPDIEPGMALKTLSKLADRIVLTTDESRKYFDDQNKLEVTGYPTRVNLKSWTSEQAYERFGLNPDLLTLLVFGGSKGARSINQAVLKILPELLEIVQIIHISGSLDWAEVELTNKNLEKISDFADRYHPYEYLHEEMGAALTAADCVLSRAGASSLGEYPLFGLPAILVPYPHAWQYQVVNARYLSSRGAAVIVNDEDLQENLLPQARELMTNNELREKMGNAMHALHMPYAAENIAAHLREMAGEKKQ